MILYNSKGEKKFLYIFLDFIEEKFYQKQLTSIINVIIKLNLYIYLIYYYVYMDFLFIFLKQIYFVLFYKYIILFINMEK